MRARYTPNTAKILEVLLWLANRKSGIDIYHVIKCAFYADKYHLNAYGRPVTGDDYIADTYGPLGKVMHGLLRSSPMEILALGGNGKLPFRIEDRWAVIPERDANARKLSESDIEALERAVIDYSDLSFDELVIISHDEEAYVEADGALMRYDLLVEEGIKRKVVFEQLSEEARHVVL